MILVILFLFRLLNCNGKVETCMQIEITVGEVIVYDLEILIEGWN